VHVPGVRVASLDGSRAWRTPLGEIEPDHELAEAVLEEAQGRVVSAPEAHDGDHAIEVQLPFVQVRWPDARFLAISVPADERAPEVGRVLGDAIKRWGRRALVVASSDLTHYGDRFGFTPWGVGRRALERAHGRNDVGLLERLEALDAEGALATARRDHSACGGGAIAATWAAARALGASSARILAHTSSSAVSGEADTVLSVGYAAAALLR
jgi:AmmeMemoRadiSam system protein B